VHNAPTDLMTYQELLTEVRPDWIIETGTRTGGRAMFLASVCDLLGTGRVVSVGPKQGPDLPTHDRVTYVEGTAHDRHTVNKVKDIVGKDPKGLLILGTRGGRKRMNQEFQAYSRFVSVGSYAVMEHTVLNGYPVDASFGLGPFEAVRNILNQQGTFVADTKRLQHRRVPPPGEVSRRVTTSEACTP
jgi:cephalosporin hydroxylase